MLIDLAYFQNFPSFSSTSWTYSIYYSKHICRMYMWNIAYTSNYYGTPTSPIQLQIFEISLQREVKRHEKSNTAAFLIRPHLLPDTTFLEALTFPSDRSGGRSRRLVAIGVHICTKTYLNLVLYIWLNRSILAWFRTKRIYNELTLRTWNTFSFVEDGTCCMCICNPRAFKEYISGNASTAL